MTDNQPACTPEMVERARAESLSLFPARMRDGHAYHTTADVLDKCAAAIERLSAENERMRDLLERLEQLERNFSLPALVQKGKP